jgi:cytochrome P450 family 117 subfamily A
MHTLETAAPLPSSGHVFFERVLRQLPLGPRQKQGLPVARGYLPALGHIASLIADLPGLMQSGASQGPLFWMNLGGARWVLASTHEDWFAILRNKETSSAILAEMEGEAIAGNFLGRSVVVLDGSAHRRTRGAMNGPFTPRGMSAVGMGQAIAEVIGARVSVWPSQARVPIAVETREIAIDVIFRTLGIPQEDLRAWRLKFEEMLSLAIPVVGKLPGSAGWRGRRARAFVDDRLRDIVRAARSRPAEESFVTALVHGRDEEGQCLDEDELVDNLRVLVIAGHETTASVMAWAILHLAEEPALWHRLVEESLRFERPPMAPDELSRFPLAEGLFRESLRMHPPAALDVREVVAPATLLGHTLLPGDIVALGIYGLLRNADRYPHPDVFDPDRWVSASKRPGPLETAPFGGGPHFCLGYHMAWLEAVHFIVAFARTLGARGLCPKLERDGLPSPVWFPVLRPPRSAAIRLSRVS